MKTFLALIILPFVFTGCESTFRLEYAGKGGTAAVEWKLPPKKGLQK